jgi:hypothetical protein
MSDFVLNMMPKNVLKAVNKTAPRTLLQSGKYIWGIARSLIKQRRNPDASSAPGTPVYSHQNNFSSGFKKTIVYALAPDGRSIVVGPKAVSGGLTELARSHEFGGTRMVNKVDPELYNGVRIGAVAPVTQQYIAKRDSVVSRDNRHDPRTGRSVSWIRIRTRSQAEHSTRLYKRMIRRYPQKVMAFYPARPFMRPALELGRPKLSGFWKNSVKP